MAENQESSVLTVDKVKELSAEAGKNLRGYESIQGDSGRLSLKGLMQEKDEISAAKEEAERRNTHTLLLDGPDFMDKEAAAIYDSDSPIFCLFSVDGSDEVRAVLRPYNAQHKTGVPDANMLSIVTLERRNEQDENEVKQPQGRHSRQVQYTPTQDGTVPRLKMNLDTERMLIRGRNSMIVPVQTSDQEGAYVTLELDNKSGLLQIKGDSERKLHVFANRQARYEAIPNNQR